VILVVATEDQIEVECSAAPLPGGALRIAVVRSVYAKEIHQALNNRRDRDARIVAWFRRYLR